jgi:hypothetical protein
MSALNIPLSTNAHDDRAVGVLLHRDDALLLALAGGRRGVLQRALNPDRAQAVLGRLTVTVGAPRLPGCGILTPAAFFLSVPSLEATQPNALVSLAYVGGVVFAVLRG